MEIKPFSEDISYGQEFLYADSFTSRELVTSSELQEIMELLKRDAAGSYKKITLKAPQLGWTSKKVAKDILDMTALEILEAVQKNKSTWQYRDKTAFITQELFDTAKNRVKKELKQVKKGPPILPPIAEERYIIKLEKLVNLKYPKGSLTTKTSQILSKNIAEQIAKKKGIRLTAKLLTKWTGKILPWIGWGVVVADLIRRGMKELDKEEKSESNIVPFGEYYHRDVGWY